MTDEKWNDIQQNIKSLIGQNNYVNWISPLGFNGVFDGVALFDVPTNFLGNYVDQNFGEGLAPGAKYCYRLVAEFALPTGGESFVSEESCTIMLADAPGL